MAETAALGVLQFQQKIKGAVRPNLFQVNHDFPSVDGLSVNKELATFLCKSAALPASTVGTVELPFRGRVIKVLATEPLNHGLLHSTWMMRLSYVVLMKSG